MPVVKVLLGGGRIQTHTHLFCLWWHQKNVFVWTLIAALIWLYLYCLGGILCKNGARWVEELGKCLPQCSQLFHFSFFFFQILLNMFSIYIYIFKLSCLIVWHYSPHLLRNHFWEKYNKKRRFYFIFTKYDHKPKIKIILHNSSSSSKKKKSPSRNDMKATKIENPILKFENSQ